MPALLATDVSRAYGSQQVLKDFSLSLENGSFEALMGPSGSGKSTFLHVAAGLLAADSGTVLVGGKDVTKMSDGAVTKFRRRHVGVVFQSFNLLNGSSVRENILMPLILDGACSKRRVPDEIESRLRAQVDRLGLGAVLGKRPSELSGGERQRVAFARALMAEPEVILADEPTGNLDAAAAKEVSSILGTLATTTRSAILVVTHDPQVAACARKVHFLKDGRIAASYLTEGSAARVSQLYLETYA